MQSEAMDGGAPACELRQAQFGLFLLRVLQPDWWAVQAYVADRVGSAPGLLHGAAVVLDVDALASLPSAEDAADLLHRLRAAGLQPLALACTPGEAALQMGRLFGLPVIAPERGRRLHPRGDVEEAPAPVEASPPPVAAEGVDEPAPAAADSAAADSLAADTPTAPTIEAPIPTASASGQAAAAPQAAAAAASTGAAQATAALLPPMYLNQPVRSGQQVYARGRDLVVTATVNAGAEVIADGSIHVYGRLAGKALAGARGDLQARIHCLDFQPELVSIAGHYRLLESIPADLRGRTVQVQLEGERMEIRALARSS